MNLDKSRTKIDLTKVLGAQFANMSEEAGKDQLRQEAARDALKLAAQRVGELGLHVTKDLDEGVLSPSDLKDPKTVEIFIKKYIKRAVGVLDNLATSAEVARMIANGREKGVAAAEQVVRTMCEAEIAKLQEIERQLQAGELTVEEVRAGGHPGLPLKYQRQDEEAAEATVKSEAQSEAGRGSEVQSGPAAKPEPESGPEPASESGSPEESAETQKKKRLAQKAMAAAIAQRRAKRQTGGKTRG